MGMTTTQKTSATGWFGTAREALGLVHMPVVKRVASPGWSAWYIWCPTCEAWLGGREGYKIESPAVTIALRHAQAETLLPEKDAAFLAYVAAMEEPGTQYHRPAGAPWPQTVQ